MISIENALYSDVATVAKAEFAGLYTTSEYSRTAPSFPCLSIMETSNVTVPMSETAASVENTVFFQVQIDVYSNKTNGKKAEAKNIFKFVDDYILSEYGMRRTMMNPVPNMEDATIYRITARYEGYLDIDTSGIYTRV